MQIFVSRNGRHGGITPLFSYFDPPLDKEKDREPDDRMDLASVFDIIRSEKLKEQTLHLRALAPNQGEAERDFTHRQQRFKLQHFPAFTPWGVFRTRRKDGLITPSWVACIDIDHIPSPADVISKLVHDPLLGVVGAFVSPRGHGAKIFVAVEHWGDDLSQEQTTSIYATFYQGLRQYLGQIYALPWDSCVETPSQPCYLAYDPEAYLIADGTDITPFNPDPWIVEKNGPAIGTGHHLHLKSDGDYGRTKLELLVQKIRETGIDITQDYSGEWVPIAFALANEFGAQGLNYFLDISRNYPQYNEEEARKKYLCCLRSSEHEHGNTRKCTLGTVFYIAERHGVDVGGLSSRGRFPQKNITAELRMCGIAENSDATSPSTFGAAETEELRKKSKPQLTDDEYAILEEAADAFGPETEYYSSDVEKDLPSILQTVSALYTRPGDKDIVILSCLVALSSVLPNVSGYYGDEELSPHLYLFIVAEAASQKHLMRRAETLVTPIHKMLINNSAAAKMLYEKQLRAYESSDEENEEKPQEPPSELLIVTADCSAAKFRWMLSQNQNGILMFETEGESLANTFSKEYGNFSSAFRKAYQHERIGSQLRTEDLDIEHPRLAALLSGTPDQVTSLIHDPLNGLFSRFIFLVPETNDGWISQKPVYASGKQADKSLRALGESVILPMYEKFRNAGFEFRLTDEQWAHHDLIFSPLYDRCNGKLRGMRASVVRMGMILFRLAMILTALRVFEMETPEAEIIECCDKDFETAERICRFCLHSTVSVLSTMKVKTPMHLPRRKDLFLAKLPHGVPYDTTTWQQVATNLNINVRSAERYHNDLIKAGQIKRDSNGKFVINNN